MYRMGFHSFIDLLWIIVSAAALCVSCQQLTSTLPEGNLICPGDEIIFTCIIKGSPTLTSLILGWSSSEYIGPIGLTYLQFTTDSIPGANETSMIDGNVTATLTNNTVVNGVPVLESQLRIIANKDSSTPTVTCHSLSNESAASTKFYLPAQLIYAVAATEISSVPGPCTLLFALQLPFNIPARDVDHYIISIPSANINTNKTSTLFHILIPQCTSSVYNICVQSVDRCGHVGSKTVITPHLLTSDIVATGTPPYYDGVQPVPAYKDYSAHVASGVATFISILALIVGIVAIALHLFLRKKRVRRERERFYIHQESIDGGPNVQTTEVALPQKNQEKYHDIDTSRSPKEQVGNLPPLPPSILQNLTLAVRGATAHQQPEGAQPVIRGAIEDSEDQQIEEHTV